MLETKAAEAELKRELQRVVEALLEESDADCNLETSDFAINTLSALKQLKLKNPNREFVEMNKGCYGWSSGEIDGPPIEFRCPISGFLMNDPVVLASGQTYDKPSIEKWLKDGHQRCPQSDQLLTHTVITPNHSIKKMILKWYKVHNIQIPSTLLDGDSEFTVNANQEYLITLLEKLSSPTVSDAKEAAKEVRMLTNRLPSIRALFGDIPDPFSRLFHPLLLERANSDKGLREDLVAIVLNISIHDRNKKRLGEETPSAVSFLIKSLRDEMIQTRTHAAAAMSALSDIDSNKTLIGQMGAIKHLIDLIEEENELALKDAVSALKKLCTLVENRERAVSEGAVFVIMSKINDCMLMDEMFEILAMLSSHQRTIDEMEEHGGIFLLFSVLREKSTSEQNKEICVSILYTMCFNDRRKVRKIREVQNAQETLSQVLRTGTSRAKRKANGILERLNRFAFLAHTA